MLFINLFFLLGINLGFESEFQYIDNYFKVTYCQKPVNGPSIIFPTIREERLFVGFCWKFDANLYAKLVRREGGGFMHNFANKVAVYN